MNFIQLSAILCFASSSFGCRSQMPENSKNLTVDSLESSKHFWGIIHRPEDELTEFVARTDITEFRVAPVKEGSQDLKLVLIAQSIEKSVPVVLVDNQYKALI